MWAPAPAADGTSAMSGARRALISGISGMDGSHLADLLLDKGYEVHGIIRRCSRPVTERIAHLTGQIELHEGDLHDQGSLDRVVSEVSPHEVYNLAAQSFVGTSWQQPVLTAEVTGLGALRMLEAVRHHAPEGVRFYQASSSEMFGNAQSPQCEETPLRPRSPYGTAKVFAHNTAVNYRESFDLHVSCGILYNHESDRRGMEFVTRKISRGVAEIVHGKRKRLALGNLSACRDWGYAPEYVEAMWLMLQQDEPDDYVIATGQTASVSQFVNHCFRSVGMLSGGYVGIDESAYRPAELHTLLGDPSKAREKLGWEAKTTVPDLARIMVEHDMALLSGDLVGVG